MARRLYEDAFGYTPIPAYSGLDTLIHGTPGLPSYAGAGGAKPKPYNPVIGMGADAGLNFIPPGVDPNLILGNATARAQWQAQLADLMAQRQVIPQQLRAGLSRLGESQQVQSSDLGANLAARGLFGGVPREGQQRLSRQFNQQRQDLSFSAEQQLGGIARAIASGQAGLASALAQNALQFGGGQGTVTFGGSAPGWGSQGFGSAGAPYAMALFNTAKGLFPGIGFDGIFSNRNIRGTSILSTHALGNAVDLGVPNQKVGMQLYNWLRQNQGQWGIHTILYDPAGAHGLNPGDHVNHIHVDWGYSPWSGWSGFGGGQVPGYGTGSSSSSYSTPRRSYSPPPRRRPARSSSGGGGGSYRNQ